MSFDNILGQDRPKQILDKALRSGRIPNAYLFYGQKSVGKKLTKSPLFTIRILSIVLMCIDIFLLE